MRQIKLSDYREDQSVRTLLRLAADPVDEQALQSLLDECEELLVLAAFDEREQIVGLAAYEHADRYALCLEYLAVLDTHQGQGIATDLLHELLSSQKKSIWATTDADAIGFYRALGCTISESAKDPRWPEARRYLCTLAYRPFLSSQPDEDEQYEAVEGQLMRGAVHLAEPSERWPEDFQKLHTLLSNALGPTALAVEHTGSTSVPGLPAKPLIDICLLVPDANDEDSYVQNLRAAGLLFWHREPGWYAHRMFKPADPTLLPDANIHVFSAGSPEYLRMVRFRDHLRSHPADRDAYAAVKKQAARTLNSAHGDTGLIMDYNKIKEPFILELHRRLFA